MENLKLNIENIISFLKENYNIWEVEYIDENTFIDDLGIEGDDAVEMLSRLSEKFEINFENFDFRKYFHEEIELSKAAGWFGLKKIRKIENRLSIQDLFQYMSKNNKII